MKCFQKNSLAFFLGGGGGGFKITSYTIVGVHPDIKIEFFDRHYLIISYNIPVNSNIVLLFFLLLCNVVRDQIYDETKLNLT